jgi:hypothetical protein
MSIADKLTRAKQDIDDVYEAGKKSEYDLFWDAHQNYGNRTAYSNFAYSPGWNDETFKPKYDIRPTGSCNGLFRDCRIIDLEGTLQKCGVVLDTSKATSLNSSFYNTTTQIFPTIDLTSINSATGTNFSFTSAVRTIRKIVCSESTPWHYDGFRMAVNLVNLIFEGVIGQSGLYLGKSTKLSKESITSVINALSTSTDGLSVTLSKTAVNNAFGINVDDANTYPEGSEYYTLRHSKGNWTINYE